MPKVLPYAKDKGSPSPTDATSEGKQTKDGVDMSVCMSLLTLFDFEKPGRVTKEDWVTGMRVLQLHALAENDAVWKKIVDVHGNKGTGTVELYRIKDLVPIDPRISVLLHAVVHALVGMREFVRKSTVRGACP